MRFVIHKHQARSEAVPAHNTARNGIFSSNNGHSLDLYGGAAKGSVPSAGGSVSAEAYRRQHEITVSVSSYKCVELKLVLMALFSSFFPILSSHVY